MAASFDNYTPTQWLQYLQGSNSVAPEQLSFPYGTFGPALPPTPLDPPYLTTPRGDSTGPPLPFPPLVALQPPKWHKIPQRPYDRGRRQRHFIPSEPILFQVKEFPGVNMGNALRGIFTGLENQDDLVLQDAKMAISCRFLFPGYPRNGSPQIFTTYWDEERSPITRSTLAYRVARKLNDYLDSMSDLNIDSSTEAQWQIGEGFMHLDNMYLAKLESTSRGSFQPQVWVMDPTV